MRHGAFDYLTKPINTDDLTAVVGKAIEIASLRRENRLLHEQLDVASMAAAFIAESASSRNLAAIVRKAAPANSPVLIEGESGTGKELVARMLHHWSSRAQGPVRQGEFQIARADRIVIRALRSARRGRKLELPRCSPSTSSARRAARFSSMRFPRRLPEFQSALLRLIGDGENSRNYGAAHGRTPRTSG